MQKHVTIGAIQQTQDAANVFSVYRHYRGHAAWPMVSYWDSW